MGLTLSIVACSVSLTLWFTLVPSHQDADTCCTATTSWTALLVSPLLVIFCLVCLQRALNLFFSLSSFLSLSPTHYVFLSLFSAPSLFVSLHICQILDLSGVCGGGFRPTKATFFSGMLMKADAIKVKVGICWFAGENVSQCAAMVVAHNYSYLVVIQCFREVVTLKSATNRKGQDDKIRYISSQNDQYIGYKEFAEYYLSGA